MLIMIAKLIVMSLLLIAACKQEEILPQVDPPMTTLPVDSPSPSPSPVLESETL